MDSRELLSLNSRGIGQKASSRRLEPTAENGSERHAEGRDVKHLKRRRETATRDGRGGSAYVIIAERILQVDWTHKTVLFSIKMLMSYGSVFEGVRNGETYFSR